MWSSTASIQVLSILCYLMDLYFFMPYRALWLNIPGLIIVVTICTLDGMVIFATYADCDLRETKKISRGDQVKIRFRERIWGSIPAPLHRNV